MTAAVPPAESGARKVNQTRRNWLLDVALLIVFMLVSAPITTGITLHEWLGLIIFVPVLYHLLWHWKWVVGVFTQATRKLPGQTKFAKWFNLGLFVMIIVAGVSGLMMSEALLPALGWQVAPDNFWLTVHKVSATLMMFLIGVHLALHWRWVANQLRRKQSKGAS